MLKEEGFEILVASPPEYTRLVAEVYYDGRFVALVSQERGAGSFDVETPGPSLDESRIVRRVEFNGLINAIEEARKRLWSQG